MIKLGFGDNLWIFIERFDEETLEWFISNQVFNQTCTQIGLKKRARIGHGISDPNLTQMPSLKNQECEA